MMKKYLVIILIIFLSIPTFAQMLRMGIFSMQDFHYFRLVEFIKCVNSLQIPCRWAADSGAGFGEPLFNFYGQLPYVFGVILHLVGVAKIDALKITFILSFVLSAVFMSLLSKKIWKNDFSALASAILYLYAPYRAVDVWVRGALPEAISFVFFPLIILFIEKYLEKRKNKDLLIFSLLFGLLILNHNLSIILFAPFLIGWLVFRFIQIKEVKPFLYLTVGGIFSLVLSAFYILPVIFESKFIDINSTTLGVYDWRANFVIIYQLFISRFWGYGGSTWGDGDGLSLSLGQIQWIVPAIALVIAIIRRKVNKETMTFLVIVLIGIFGLFLTHNKSTFIWNALPFMKYIQFPWRFLAMSVFAFALASGQIVKRFSETRVQMVVAAVIIIGAIILNFNFFKPDIWYLVGDQDLETGPRWDEARFSSLADYWPNFGHKYPDKISDGKYINYFPGWNKEPDENGLISSNGAVFSNTPVRNLGNWISLVAIGVWIVFFVKFKYAKDS